MKFAVCLVVLIFSSLTVAAQIEGNPDNWCREGFFTRDSESFGTGFVKGAIGRRIYFFNDLSDKCPESASCRAKAYVMRGDRAIVNRTRGNFACAWFAPSKGAPTVGWIKLSDLDRPVMLSDASVPRWLGEWRYGRNSISFTENKLPGYLNVTGDALWKGPGDNVHIGELNGLFEPKNGILEYSDGDGEYDCKATMRIVGSFLVVADNMKCGGVNVTFSGVYLRKRK